MIAWLDRLLLSFPREAVDRLAMGLTAATVLFVVVLLGVVARSLGHHADDTRDEGARR